MRGLFGHQNLGSCGLSLCFFTCFIVLISFGSTLVYIHNNGSNISLCVLYCFQTTASQTSLFDHLINIWEFKPGPIPGTCDLHFFVDFKFQSPLYRQVNLSLLF